MIFFEEEEYAKELEKNHQICQKILEENEKKIPAQIVLDSLLGLIPSR